MIENDFNLSFAPADSYRRLLDQYMQQRQSDLYNLNGGIVQDRFKFYSMDIKAATGQVLTLLESDIKPFMGLTELRKSYRTGTVMTQIAIAFEEIRAQGTTDFLTFWERLEEQSVIYTGDQMPADDINIRLSMVDTNSVHSRLHKMQQANFSQYYKEAAMRLKPFCIRSIQESLDLLAQLSLKFGFRFAFRPLFTMPGREQIRAHQAALRGGVGEQSSFMSGGAIQVDESFKNIFGTNAVDMLFTRFTDPSTTAGLYWQWWNSGAFAVIHSIPESSGHWSLQLAPTVFPPFLIQRVREHVPVIINHPFATLMLNDSVHTLTDWDVAAPAPGYVNLAESVNMQICAELLASIAYGLTLIAWCVPIGQGAKRPAWHSSPLSLESMRLYPRYAVRAMEEARLGLK